MVDTAKKDGLIFDPVYTIKVWAGMLDLAKKKSKILGSQPLFIHTGGIFGTLAKADEISPLLID